MHARLAPTEKAVMMMRVMVRAGGEHGPHFRINAEFAQEWRTIRAGWDCPDLLNAEHEHFTKPDERKTVESSTERSASHVASARIRHCRTTFAASNAARRQSLH